MADIRDALALFMELQTLGDKVLRKLAFDHVVHTIRRMNKKSKNQTMNRALQKIMFETLKVCNFIQFYPRRTHKYFQLSANPLLCDCYSKTMK